MTCGSHEHPAPAFETIFAVETRKHSRPVCQLVFILSIPLTHIKNPEKKGPTWVNTWMIVLRRASSCGL